MIFLAAVPAADIMSLIYNCFPKHIPLVDWTLILRHSDAVDSKMQLGNWSDVQKGINPSPAYTEPAGIESISREDHGDSSISHKLFLDKYSWS